MLAGRLALLSAFPYGDKSALEDAEVYVDGVYAVYAVLPENQKAIRDLARLLRT